MNKILAAPCLVATLVAATSRSLLSTDPSLKSVTASRSKRTHSVTPSRAPTALKRGERSTLTNAPIGWILSSKAPTEAALNFEASSRSNSSTNQTTSSTASSKNHDLNQSRLRGMERQRYPNTAIKHPRADSR